MFVFVLTKVYAVEWLMFDCNRWNSSGVLLWTVWQVQCTCARAARTKSWRSLWFVWATVFTADRRNDSSAVGQFSYFLLVLCVCKITAVFYRLRFARYCHDKLTDRQTTYHGNTVLRYSCLTVRPSVCPSVCNVGGLWSHALEFRKTNFTAD